MREILLKLNKKILGNILNVIYNSPLGVTIEDIVNSTGHHRVTVQRYITRLEELGFVKLKRIGHYVLVFPANLIKQIENDFPSLLLDSTIHVIQKNLKLNHINLFEIGKELGEAISDEIINDVKEYFRKIGDKIRGDLISPDLGDYELKITGGSDTSGFPMRPGIPGTGKRKILLSGGVGFKPKRKGERRRKSVRGEIISSDISQINTIIVKEGKKKLEDIFGKKGENKQENENSA